VDVQARNLIAERARQARQDFFDRQAEQPMLVARVPRLPDLTGPASLPPPPGSLALWRTVPEPTAPVQGPAPTPASRAQQTAATNAARVQTEIQRQRAAELYDRRTEQITVPVPALGTSIQVTMPLYPAFEARREERLSRREEHTAARAEQSAASHPAPLSPR